MHRGPLFAIFAVVATLMFGARSAQADVAVDLYTVGPGSYLFARYGHSLLCVDDETCYDYGVPDREDAAHVSWSSIRGDAIFVPVRVAKTLVLETFGGQGRSIEKQRLPLTADEAARLVARLESDVREKRAYAYHPYFANCTTQIRDAIDSSTHGRLRPGFEAAPPLRFREFAEEGLTGQLGQLMFLSFALGSPNERKPSPWEVMFLPVMLRDGVAERFAVPPEHVAENQTYILPTSRAAGRFAIGFLGFVLFAVIHFASRKSAVDGTGALTKRMRRGLAIVGITLGAMALVAELVALVVVWPEFRQNSLLLLLLPTDFALPFLSRKWLAIYARVRLGMAAVFVVLEIAGVIAQPVIPIAVLFAFAFGGVLSSLREAANREEDKDFVRDNREGAR